MKSILGSLTYVAVAGFCVSFLVHILAWIGLPSPFGSATWLLHIGIFVVWMPTVLVVQRLAKGVKQANVWKAVLRGCPTWVRTGLYVVGAYAFVNFFLFIAQTAAFPKNHVPDVLQLRGFSGHWLVFYYAAGATLYSANRIGLAQPHCPNGHDVSPFARFCDECGVRL